MPITTRVPIRPLSQAEFGEISFEVMRHVFAIHNEIGRFFDGPNVSHQRFRLAAPGVALKITAFDSPLDPYEIHARRLLAHADLQAIAWVNITMKKVTFTTLER